MHQDDDEVHAVVEALGDYLRANPRASDTAEGIATWWLGGSRSVDPRIFEHALQSMVARGIIQKVTRCDGHVLYRVCAQGGNGAP